jgi:hypothetical protein
VSFGQRNRGIALYPRRSAVEGAGGSRERALELISGWLLGQLASASFMLVPVVTFMTSLVEGGQEQEYEMMAQLEQMEAENEAANALEL